jgi:hypothetical protein
VRSTEAGRIALFSRDPEGRVRKRAPQRRAPLDRRVGIHDRQQFELKLHYQSAEGERRSRYLVETFMFLPGSLNVGPDTVPAPTLYGDIHNYIRLRTPEYSWSEIDALPTAPLPRAKEEAKKVAAGADPQRFVYECKLFATVLRATLRDFVDRLEDLAPPGSARQRELLDEALDGGSGLVSRFRQLGPIVRKEGFPERARLAWELADEHASVSIEQQLRRAIVKLDKAGLGSKALYERLLGVILEEESYRRERAYPSILDPSSDNEAYVHRAGLLKKFCTSALFLEIRRMAAQRTWQELFFAISAGIAMAFATVVAFWAQARYSQLEVRLLLIFVVVYMFKDRLKEASRAFFARFLDKHFWDRVIHIADPRGGSLGRCREKIEYLRPDRVPSDVLAARAALTDPAVRLVEEELAETVTHYKKEIVLAGQHAVTDILRFHIGRLTRDMDEQFQKIDWVDRETFDLAPIKAAKVYHIDVVFRFTTRAGEPPVCSLERLVVDRRGIKRLGSHMRRHTSKLLPLSVADD